VAQGVGSNPAALTDILRHVERHRIYNTGLAAPLVAAPRARVLADNLEDGNTGY
jgi:hypothetical protein